MSELPGMWEEADLSGGWADTDSSRKSQALRALEEKAPEQVRRLRHVTEGWGPDDTRWDSLSAVFAYHAHELAEKQRAAEAQWRQSGYEGTRPKGWLIDLIDPEVSTDG